MSIDTEASAVLKFCPRCGSAKFSTQNKPSFFLCAACNFNFYFNNAAAVCVLLFDKNHRLLLTERAKDPQKGFLGLPGGFVDFGETAEAALTREIKEELGLNITDFTYLTSFPNTYLYKGLTYHTLDMAFMSKNVNTAKIVLEKSEIAGIRSLPIEKINLQDIGFKSMQNIIQFYFNKFNS